MNGEQSSNLDLVQAWRYFHHSVESARTALANAPQFVTSDLARAQAYAYLAQVQAAAFNTVIAPRPDYPRLYTQTVWEPVYSWLAPNPDFIYGYTVMNPRRSYRIRGRVGDARMVVFQLQSMLFGRDMQRLGDYQIKDLEVADDGSYEITLSPDFQPGNWFRLDPSHPINIMTIRRALLLPDDDPGEMAIEPLSLGAHGPIEPSAALVAERLKAAGEMIEFVTDKLTLDLYNKSVEHGGINGTWVWGGAGSDVGGAESATYGWVRYRIADDEALLIETDVPDSTYWGAQLNDVWLDTLDYTYHQSSLSSAQSSIDGDGKFRCVISLADPGVPNWLDAVGNNNGVLVLRWYDAIFKPEVKVSLVKLAELRGRLPAETPVVSRGEREQILLRRQRGFLKRYST